MRDPDRDLTIVAAALAGLIAYILTAGLKSAMAVLF